MWERNNDWLPFACGPTRDWSYNPGTCSDQKSNQQPFAPQYIAQTTEPHRSGLCILFFCNYFVLPKVIIIFYLCSFLCSYYWSVPKVFNSSVSAPPNIHTCPHSQPPRSPVTTCSRLGCLLSRPDVQPSTWGFLPHHHGDPFVCSEMVPVSWIPCLHFPRFIPSSM